MACLLFVSGASQNPRPVCPSPCWPQRAIGTRRKSFSAFGLLASYQPSAARGPVARRLSASPPLALRAQLPIHHCTIKGSWPYCNNLCCCVACCCSACCYSKENPSKHACSLFRLYPPAVGNFCLETLLSAVHWAFPVDGSPPISALGLFRSARPLSTAYGIYPCHCQTYIIHESLLCPNCSIGVLSCPRSPAPSQSPDFPVLLLEAFAVPHPI